LGNALTLFVCFEFGLPTKFLYGPMVLDDDDDDDDDNDTAMNMKLAAHQNYGQMPSQTLSET
jgi:hypothetical protein